MVPALVPPMTALAVRNIVVICCNAYGHRRAVAEIAANTHVLTSDALLCCMRQCFSSAWSPPQNQKPVMLPQHGHKQITRCVVRAHLATRAIVAASYAL